MIFASRDQFLWLSEAGITSFYEESSSIRLSEWNDECALRLCLRKYWQIDFKTHLIKEELVVRSIQIFAKLLKMKVPSNYKLLPSEYG